MIKSKQNRVNYFFHAKIDCYIPILILRNKTMSMKFLDKTPSKGFSESNKMKYEIFCVFVRSSSQEVRFSRLQTSYYVLLGFLERPWQG